MKRTGLKPDGPKLNLAETLIRKVQTNAIFGDEKLFGDFSLLLSISLHILNVLRLAQLASFRLPSIGPLETIDFRFRAVQGTLIVDCKLK